MLAEQINASIAGTSSGAYILGRTLKEWMDRERTHGSWIYLTSEGNLILDDEMYFVNEHGIWLVE